MIGHSYLRTLQPQALMEARGRGNRRCLPHLSIIPLREGRRERGEVRGGGGKGAGQREKKADAIIPEIT